MIRYFFLLRKTESGRQNQNSLPFLFMGKILSLLKRIKISKGEIKWKENILSTGFKSVLYNITGVDFGSGKRSLIKGGYLHPGYQITVPHSWKPEAADA